MRVTQLILFGPVIYLALGAAFAVVFVVRGIHRVDTNARGGSWAFRLLMIPGAVALWPLVAWRWRAAVVSPEAGP